MKNKRYDGCDSGNASPSVLALRGPGVRNAVKTRIRVGGMQSGLPRSRERHIQALTGGRRQQTGDGTSGGDDEAGPHGQERTTEKRLLCCSFAKPGEKLLPTRRKKFLHLTRFHREEDQ